MRRGVREALLLAFALSMMVVGASDLISGTIFVRRIALAGQVSTALLRLHEWMDMWCCRGFYLYVVGICLSLVSFLCARAALLSGSW